ncbi:MaoC/PaaZ C-terminal domain-containing protein [Photorhabdus heterorhabditis]|uniref:MaoC-like domain-containing protein n=1 Tax=Photorhabdus heterorhabditis TaxID=880156 RepID=A0A5B0WLY2_9GAMM|nr:MaoC/PaaZ C-terminal domain-containing protein [Photorhabdus heterorhabditis]KAA1187972.1 hypothetical protein F0L16_11755 [Photorhabdus heterorhabditis]KOY61956.1 hypothetical protein AM629_11000 [Photorhabdus heterorhabditis]MBS9441613.1 hypothetical protein [Photorhabdus heterorhabditis]
MNVQFSKEDLKQWAEFSGDYNPIHFDEKIAREVGLGGIAVHGMLAMIPLKSGYHHSSQPNENIGRQWHVNLRNPVPLDACYCIKTKHIDLNGKTTFNLQDEITNLKLLVGHYSCFDFSQKTRFLEKPQCQVPLQETIRKSIEFKNTFPRVNEFWIFLDALIFYLFMQQSAKTALATEFKNYFGKQGRHDETCLKDLIVLHVMHTVSFSPALLNREIPDEMPSIEYSILPKDTFDVDGSLYGTLEIPIWLNGEIVLVVEMSLMGTTKRKQITN